MITITNECNMELMKRYPDNHFDLAIVDPPYGINMAMGHKGSKKRGDKNKYKNFAGNDTATPKKEYWDELFRVSKNQIIWGGNYMTEYLGSTPCFIIWDKVQPEAFSMAMCEFAWTSFKSPAKIFKKVARGGFLTKGTIDHRIHPTQKPVKLYEWLLMNYAKEGDKILDTHGGSMSIAIACHNLGFNLTACELDTEYYEASLKRLKQHQSQLTMF
jgi:site-specific DNA-methyltransferase (adenine-specific)